MARSTATPARASRLAIIPSTLRLALWRLRQTWRLLLGAGLGILAAVTIVCAVPLFSEVATSAGLRGAFDDTSDANDIAVNVYANTPSADNIQQIGSTIDTLVQDHLGKYLHPGHQFSIQFQSFPLIDESSGVGNGSISSSAMQVMSYDSDQLASHATLVAGRLPRAGASPFEIVLTKDTADLLGATVGMTLSLNSGNNPAFVNSGDKLSFTVVGLIGVKADDPFFHHVSFEPQSQGTSLFYRALATNDDLVSLLQQISVSSDQRANAPTQLNWYYTLDQTRLDSGALGKLITQAIALQVELPNNLVGLPGSPNGSIFGDAIAILYDYQSRISDLQVPINFLLLQVLALVLFFVSLMAEIVVDRQADAIAVLRSRGASRLQIFGALVMQSLGLGVIALVVGPLLALAAVVMIARFSLAPENQSSLDILTNNPLQAAYDLRWFAIAAVVVAMGAMIIAINRATSSDVLSMRRESARTTRKPLWQRLNLDVVAAIIAVTGYILYSIVLGRISPVLQSRLGFLGLVAPFFILFAGALLFFRLYPLLLRLAAWVAGRGKGAVPMLALAQMSRSPRQSMRTTLLLAFSTAFTIFTLIFVASQTQHLRDVASFNAGADFSGALPTTTSTGTSLSDRMATYRQIPGVNSAALGYMTIIPPGSDIIAYSEQLMAVDADHYAQTATWDAHNSTQSLDSLMAQLVSNRDEAASKDVVPAILNGVLWDALHLTPGTKFTLSVPGYNGGKMHFVAVARVEHIESIYDSPQYLSGGLLVDYQSYATVFAQDTETKASPPNFIWLRSADDAASLASVRKSLTSGDLQLSNFIDRRALTERLITDPLQVDLSGVLMVGTIASIVLALVGVLTASWLSARSRLTNFAVLRALGTAPGQIAGVLIWEQGVVYGIALVLGALLGSLLSVMVLPILAFANARTNRGDLIGAANLPEIQMLVPVGSLSLAIGALIAICLGALLLMTLVVARPSVSATLRLNED